MFVTVASRPLLNKPLPIQITPPLPVNTRLFCRLGSGQIHSVVEDISRTCSVGVWLSVTVGVLMVCAPAPTTALVMRDTRWTGAATVCSSAPVDASMVSVQVRVS
jgi:hypothetical protein